MFQGFQTASGRNVQVSEKALLNARKLFEGIEAEPVPVPEIAAIAETANSPATLSPVRPALRSRNENKKNPCTVTSESEKCPATTSKAHDVVKNRINERKPLAESTAHGSSTKYQLNTVSGRCVTTQAIKKPFDELDDAEEADEDDRRYGPVGKKLKLEDDAEDTDEDDRSYEPAGMKVKLEVEDNDVEMNSQNEQDEKDRPSQCDESFNQEVLDSTFALLADEEGDEGNRNAIFGDTDPIPLLHVTQSGGKIPLLHVIILRVYPVTFMVKNEQGRNVFESEKSYKKHQHDREAGRQSKLEKLYAEAKEEVEAKERETNCNDLSIFNRSLNREILEHMPIEDLLQVIRSYGEDSFILELLSPQKILQLEAAKFKHGETIMLKIQSEFESKMNAMKDRPPTPLIKVRIIDAKDVTAASLSQNVLLSIWKPNEEVVNCLTEGSAFQVKALSPTANCLELRLNSTRSTQFQTLTTPPHTKLMLTQFARMYSTLPTILNPNFSPVFGEFDTVGIIVQIVDLGRNAGVILYLADALMNIIGIRLWTSVADQGLEAEIQLMNFVAFQNLQWRRASRKCVIPCAFVQETTVFSLKTGVRALDTALRLLRFDVKDVRRFTELCQRKVSETLDQKQSPEKGPLSAPQNGHRFLISSPPLLRRFR